MPPPATNLPEQCGSDVAVLFPGQGRQPASMREAVAKEAPILLDVIADAVGQDPFTKLDEGTQFVQPAVFCRSVASWFALRDRIAPTAVAGHSLGEISALVAAEAISVEDAAAVVAARGALTQQPASMRGMMAVNGLNSIEASRIVSRHNLAVAAYNAPRQIVATGATRYLREAKSALRAAGGTCVDLEISGAFHSPLLRPLIPTYLGILRRASFRPPELPVYSALTGKPFTDPARELAQSLVGACQVDNSGQGT